MLFSFVLAKLDLDLGAANPQINTPTSIHTARQIIRTNKREEWLNGWALGKTGRSVFKYMATPNPKDSINSIERREQVVIFRLRTQHIPLNAHLNRFKPQAEPTCLLCPYPYETVQHHLLECPSLQDLRETLLPQNPTIENTLYSTAEQLHNTYLYFTMASNRRAQAQQFDGSAK